MRVRMTGNYSGDSEVVEQIRDMFLSVMSGAHAEDVIMSEREMTSKVLRADEICSSFNVPADDRPMVIALGMYEARLAMLREDRGEIKRELEQLYSLGESLG